MFDNDSYNNINFLFFTLVFFFDYNDVNYNARLNLLKQYAIFNSVKSI